MNKKRQRKFIIAERRKEARAIKMELDELWKTTRVYVTPEKPIRDGWKRSFVIRYPHILSGQNSAARELLPILQSVAYCDRKDFIHKIHWPDGRRGWYWGPVEQHLRHISKRQYETLRPDLQQFFRKLSPWEMTSSIRWSRWWKFMMAPEYVFKKPYLYDLKVEKNYKDRVLLLDPDAESRKKELNEKLYGNSDLYDKKAKLLNFNNENHPGYRWRNKVANKIANKEFEQVKINKLRGGNDDDEQD